MTTITLQDLAATMALSNALGIDVDPAHLVLAIQIADKILAATHGDAKQSLAIAFKVADAIRTGHDGAGDDGRASAC